MSDPGFPPPNPPYPPPPPPVGRGVGQPLRRSRTNRIVSGVAGGLGEYFGVDPVIFRVLFAVLSFFGGVGLLAYLACWVAIAEPEATASPLDRAVEQLRVRRIPPWLVITAGAIFAWAAWFSWWAPGPTFPALLLVALLLILLVRRRQGTRHPGGWVGTPGGQYPTGWVPDPTGWPASPPAPQAATAATAEEAGGSPSPTVTQPYAPAPAPGRAPTDEPGSGALGPTLWPTGPGSPEATDSSPDQSEEPTISLFKTGEPGSAHPSEQGTAWLPPVQPPAPIGAATGSGPAPRLAPPLNDFRASMRDWISEAKQAQQERKRRRRPITVAVAVVLLVGLTVLGIVDAVDRISFAGYLWFLFAVLGLGFVISLIARRTVWAYLVPTLLLVPALVVMGATPASLTDGSGKSGIVPSSWNDLTDQRQFAGDTTVDLSALPALGADRAVRITQGAGQVELLIPSDLNVVVDASVHMGDIQVDGSRAVGKYVAGLNSTLTVPTAATGAVATGPQLSVRIVVTAGHVEIRHVS